MKIINIYKCDICGKESRNKDVISSHEVECIAKNQRKKEYQKNVDKWNREFLDTFDPTKVDECINSYLKKALNLEFKNITWYVKYSPLVSNSHGKPIHGVENFNRDETKPFGYPGFTGHIKGNYSQDETLSSFSSWDDKIQIPGIHTGSGSGNGKNWQYGFYFFLDDFPNLKKEFEEKHVVALAKANLCGDYNYTISEVYTNE